MNTSFDITQSASSNEKKKTDNNHAQLHQTDKFDLISMVSPIPIKCSI